MWNILIASLNQSITVKLVLDLRELKNQPVDKSETWARTLRSENSPVEKWKLHLGILVDIIVKFWKERIPIRTELMKSSVSQPVT